MARPGDIVVAESALPLRDCPGSLAPRVWTRSGETCLVIGSEREWLLVVLGRAVGWVYGPSTAGARRC